MPIQRKKLSVKDHKKVINVRKIEGLGKKNILNMDKNTGVRISPCR